MKMQRIGPGLLAAGLCCGLALSLPWLSALLAPAAGALLLLAMRRSRRLASQLGLLACFVSGFLGSALLWIGQSIYRPPVNQLLPSALLWLAIVALQLAIYLLCFALVHALLRAVRRPGRRRGTHAWRVAIGLATAWSLAEALRSLGPVALPWGLWGYGAIDNPVLSGFYPVGGSVLVAWLQWMLSGLLLGWWRLLGRWRRTGRSPVVMRRLVPLAWTGAALASAAMASHAVQWTHAQDSAMRIRVVHTHWPQAQKYQPDNRALALALLEQSAQSPGADLVVFPELFLVERISALAGQQRQWIAGEVQRNHGALLFGAPGMAVNAEPPHQELGQQNTLVLIDEDGMARSYAKQQLLPFTEYLPSSAWLRWIWPLLYRYPLADMVAGSAAQPALRAHGVQLGPLICSELASPLLSASQGAAAAILVVPASDSWIPSRLYVLQAHALARVRAAELQKPLVRASNAGISSFIDHHGKTLAAWSGAPGSGVWTITPRQGATPYAAMLDGLRQRFSAW